MRKIESAYEVNNTFNNIYKQKAYELKIQSLEEGLLSVFERLYKGKSTWFGKIELYFFGSLARGDFSSYSDTDIMALYNNYSGDFLDIKYIFDTELRIVNCDFICYEKTEFSLMSSFFIDNIKKDMKLYKTIEVCNEK